MKKYLKLASIFILFAMSYTAWRVYGVIPMPSNLEEEDIYSPFLEGQRILHGENPYERILNGNMHRNDKYSTYFPLFYELSAVTQALGLRDIDVWAVFWRRVFITFNLGTALILFYAFARFNMEWFGLFSAAFWLFGRWSLVVISDLQFDFIPVFFLVVSLVVFSKRHWLGLLLFGVSLAVKQLGIFIFPLYLVWIWHSVEKKRSLEVVRAVLLIACVPLFVSIPFLIWNAKGFVLSILFSATRGGGGSLGPSLDRILSLSGILGRLPMFVLFACVYWFSFSRLIGRYTGALLIMAIFISFNTTLFYQYLFWLIPLIPLLLLDSKESYSNVPVGD